MGTTISCVSGASACKRMTNVDRKGLLTLIKDDVRFTYTLNKHPQLASIYNMEMPNPAGWKLLIRYVLGKKNLYRTSVDDTRAPGLMPQAYLSENLQIEAVHVSYFISTLVTLGVLEILADRNFIEGRCRIYEGKGVFAEVHKEYFPGNETPSDGNPPYFREVNGGDTLRARRHLAFIAETEEEIHHWAATTHRWLLEGDRLKNTIAHFQLYRDKEASLGDVVDLGKHRIDTKEPERKPSESSVTKETVNAEAPKAPSTPGVRTDTQTVGAYYTAQRLDAKKEASVPPSHVSDFIRRFLTPT